LGRATFGDRTCHEGGRVPVSAKVIPNDASALAPAGGRADHLFHANDQASNTESTMSTTLKHLLQAAALCATVLSVSSSAFAASSCAGAGYLCFFDYETDQFGNVSGNNTSWGALPGNWDARADWFYNQGTSKNVCVFQNHGYTGSRYTILRGKTWQWSNYGRSNLWTSATSC
jgi:hypothetical protein